MGSDEQFSLCWNNFHSNMSTGFHGLLSRGDLVDVTLAAEGRLLQAHKLVLSVCSPYFQEMFKMNPTQHPIVFLKDVSHSALRDLLQFMYQGEVNVKQEELASFISTAEQLQVKGLTGNQNEENSTPASKPKPSSRPGPRSSQQRLSMTKPETDLDNKPNNPVAIKRPNRPSVTPTNPQSSQPAPAKRKCIDPLEAGPSGASSKEDFVTIPDDEDNAVAPKMEPEFVNEALWEDDDEGTNNDDGTFGEDDSNMDMTGFGDGSVTGDTTIAGATEGGAVGDAQAMSDGPKGKFTRKRISLEQKAQILERLKGGDTINKISEEFHLSRSTISGIVKREEKIRKRISIGSSASITQTSRVKNNLLARTENCLMTWIEERREKSVPLDGHTIKSKAIELFGYLKENERDSEETFIASNGWFEGFKRRFSLTHAMLTQNVLYIMPD